MFKYPVISLIQPYATLCAMRLKLLETRSWQTKHRGLVLFHASAGFPAAFKEFAESEILYDTFGKYLEYYGYNNTDRFERGRIVGGGEITGCYKMEQVTGDGRMILSNGYTVPAREMVVGDYRVGRYAWKIENAFKLIDQPYAKGKLNVWQYESAVDILDNNKHVCSWDEVFADPF